jgi:hypothetical protein
VNSEDDPLSGYLGAGETLEIRSGLVRSAANQARVVACHDIGYVEARAAFVILDGRYTKGCLAPMRRPAAALSRPHHSASIVIPPREAVKERVEGVHALLALG